MTYLERIDQIIPFTNAYLKQKHFISFFEEQFVFTKITNNGRLNIH